MKEIHHSTTFTQVNELAISLDQFMINDIRATLNEITMTDIICTIQGLKLKLV